MIGGYGPLIAVVAVLLGSIGSFAYGISTGEDRCTARGTRDEQIRQRTFEDAQKGTANAIAQIEIKHTTIHAAVEREVRTRVEYRTCVHAPDVVRGINAALSGRPDAPDPGKLPAGTTPAR